jgi:cation diffusion facilitator family transporter
MNPKSLTRYAWISIAAAIATIGLKSLAYWLTGSVGLLSDAIESVVNLVGAIMALSMLIIAARPPDDEHLFGHSKAEYFSSGVEGSLILIAAVSIGIAAVNRLITPKPVDQAAIGLAVSGIASLINFAVARLLLSAGKKNNSITLEADARHLMTDVWTSIGVIGGVGLVALTGLKILDPIIALIVAVNIVWSGFQIVRRSVQGLMDSALPADENKSLLNVLEKYQDSGVQFHALRTSQAAARRFISIHVLVPGNWTVKRGHQLIEQIKDDIRGVLSNATVFTHIEPVEDPSSLQDMELDR